MLTPVSPSSHKTVFVSGKYRKRSNDRQFARAVIIWRIHPFHEKNINFDCLYLLLKPEKGKIFRQIRIFYSAEFFRVVIVTDRKCSITDNVDLAILTRSRNHKGWNRNRQSYNTYTFIVEWRACSSVYYRIKTESFASFIVSVLKFQPITTTSCTYHLIVITFNTLCAELFSDLVTKVT